MSSEKAVHTFRVRTNQIRERLNGFDVDTVVISNMTDIRWACGFTGSNALLVLCPDREIFITDGRYRTQSENEVEASEIRIASSGLFSELLGESIRTLAYQSDDLRVDTRDDWQSKSVELKLVGIPNLVSPLRAEKDDSEIKRISEALAITESVLQDIGSIIKPGISEKSLAAEIDFRQRQLGGERTAFETIVAFAENSALPHARPSDRVLADNENVLVDTGCFLNGYASDITRNYFVGNPPDEYLAVYETVNTARQKAIQAASEGIRSNELDGIARSFIQAAGYDGLFSHSLGHGLGLDVHEKPRVSYLSDEILPANAVITIEPGIYIPNKYGVRIEDIVVLRPQASEKLNKLSTELYLL